MGRMPCYVWRKRRHNGVFTGCHTNCGGEGMETVIWLIGNAKPGWAKLLRVWGDEIYAALTVGALRGGEVEIGERDSPRPLL